jgi:hypothetical protein
MIFGVGGGGQGGEQIFLKYFYVSWLKNYHNTMWILHLNFLTLLNFTFYHQCDQVCNTFIYLNQYVGHDILSME